MRLPFCTQKAVSLPHGFFSGTPSTWAFAEARFSPANYLRAIAHSHTARPRHCTATARIARCPAPSRCGSRPSALGLPPGGRKAARRALRIERHRTQPPKTPVRRDLASPARRPAPRAPHPHARTSPKHAAERRPILRSAHSRPCTRSIHAVPRRRALGRIALPMPLRP